MAKPDLPADADSSQVLANGESSPQAAMRLRTALEHSRHPMLIADDQRRWVTGNTAACDLLGIPREEIPWRTMDDFTAPSERKRLEEQWGAFLASGGAEGWYQLYVPERGPIPVEFSATANVLPARHLSVSSRPTRRPPRRPGALWRVTTLGLRSRWREAAGCSSVSVNAKS